MAGEKPKTLNPKQRKFVEEYVIDENAVKAYFQAYGRLTSKGKRRSYQGAAKSAQALLQNPVIKQEIESAQAEYIRRTRTSKARVVREVAALAFSDVGDVFEEDSATGYPVPKPWSQIAPSARRAIASVKIKRRIEKAGTDDETDIVEEVEYKFAPKGPELDKLCKKLGFYKDAEAGAVAADQRAVLILPDNNRNAPTAPS